MNDPRHFRRWRRDALIPFTLFSLFALLISLALSAPAFADPPGRIGRVAWLSEPGSLTLDKRGGGETFRAPLNQPLTSGDVLSTGRNARAEVQIGSMTLRLDGGTSLELTRIDDEQVSVFLRNGRSIVRLLSPETAREFELNTPDGRVTAHDTAIFRIETDDRGSSATSYAGAMRFAANDTDIDLKAGERADIWFDGQTRYRLATPASDDFMHWSAARDQSPPSNAASRYISPEMTGADDLDAYGDWTDTPDYGPLWMPRAVTVDWAPYRTGHWVWVEPWGWNWVGQEPWGFAPFHYGRWVQYRGRWGWVPGTQIARPVYAPALVSWSAAPGFNVTFSSGRPPTAGWSPLAPREVYVPIYRSSPDYVRRVNRTHVTHIDNVDVIVGNRHDNWHSPREEPRAIAPRPELRRAPTESIWQPPPIVREQRRNDHNDDRRHEARDSRPERVVQERPPAMPPAPEQHRRLEAAVLQPSQPAAMTKPAPREMRESERPAARPLERRPDESGRSRGEDDPRKRRHGPDGDEHR